MKKLFKLFVLMMRLSAVLTLVIILIFNTSFVVGTTRFIPEGNPVIRFTELFLGSLSLPFFGYWIWEVVFEE